MIITSTSFINHVTFICGYELGVVQLALIVAPGDTFCTSVRKTGSSSGTSATYKVRKLTGHFCSLTTAYLDAKWYVSADYHIALSNCLKHLFLSKSQENVITA